MFIVGSTGAGSACTPVWFTTMAPTFRFIGEAVAVNWHEWAAVGVDLVLRRVSSLKQFVWSLPLLLLGLWALWCRRSGSRQSEHGRAWWVGCYIARSINRGGRRVRRLGASTGTWLLGNRRGVNRVHGVWIRTWMGGGGTRIGHCSIGE